jgi:hypothetical protein
MRTIVPVQFLGVSTLAWRAIIGKLEEYIASGQRSAVWTKQRLAQASAVFTLKVMFMPTHAFVGSVAHYGQRRVSTDEGKQTMVPQGLLDEVLSAIENTRWHQRSQVLQFLSRSPVVRQLRGEEAKIGGRRGRAFAEKAAQEAFGIVNHFITSEGSDNPINKCLALALREALGLEVGDLAAEKRHPWLTSLQPDLLVTADPDRIVCIEVHYTTDNRPYNLAYYILDKLDTYMRQLEAYLSQPRLL